MKWKADVSQAYGTIAAASITGTYQTLLTLTGSVVQVTFFNSLDQPVLISLDGGTTNWGLIPPDVSFSLDFGANETQFSGVIQIKHNGVAATSGDFSASAIKGA